MEITLDVSNLLQISQLSPVAFLWLVIKNGGWIILLFFIIYSYLYGRLLLKRWEYSQKVKYTLLAIDIPKNNEQSLMAMEQLFAHLYGIKGTGNKLDQIWRGRVQLAISFEIVSLEGYIQFLIRTPTIHRDFVEAAVYAQYPEAEITEVEDYVGLIPPDVQTYRTDFNFWAAELKLVKPSPYPIKTYPLFEHKLSQKFADPLAALLELMSKLQTGEQIGVQLVVRPTSDAWKQEGVDIVNKLMGIKGAEKKHLGDNLVEASLGALDRFSESVISLWADYKDPKEEKGPQSMIQFLSPGAKDEIENIEKKLARIGFKCKLRVYYLAHRDVWLPGRGINGLMGAFWQLRGYNGFKMYKPRMTNAEYFFTRVRKARIAKKFLREYKRRDTKWGAPPMILTTEELATMWHFPATLDVKAPLMKKTEARKAEPPTSLPLAQELGSSFKQAVEASSKIQDTPVAPEEFVITETLPGYNFANDYYEKHFAKSSDSSAGEEAPVEPAIIESPVAEVTSPIKKEVEPPDNLPYV